MRQEYSDKHPGSWGGAYDPSKAKGDKPKVTKPVRPPKAGTAEERQYKANLLRQLRAYTHGGPDPFNAYIDPAIRNSKYINRYKAEGLRRTIAKRDAIKAEQVKLDAAMKEREREKRESEKTGPDATQKQVAYLDALIRKLGRIGRLSYTSTSGHDLAASIDKESRTGRLTRAKASRLIDEARGAVGEEA